MKKIVLIPIVLLFAAAVVIMGCKTNNSSNKNDALNVRLQWYPHAQFAGYIVALQKGFYTEENLDVNLLPAGPDIKPTVTVASGNDHVGIGVPNQIITARSNGVPLTIIAQIFQDSPNRYILKSENKINSLKELSGKSAGLWLGGDEAEFISMLASEGMKLEDVNIVSQGFTVTPFLEDKYDLSQVTTYNELIQVQDEGYDGDKLQILSPKDYNSAILGDMIFSTDKFVVENKDVLARFLDASIRGWEYTIKNPDDALKIVLDYNPELEQESQKKTLDAVIELITSGGKQIGYMNQNEYENIQRILLESGQIKDKINVSKVYNSEVWNQVLSERKAVMQ